MIPRTLAVLATSAALWVGACDDNGTGPSEILAELKLSVQSAAIEVGETLDLVATVLDGNGDQVNTATLAIQWVSSDPSVAQVDSAGVVTGIAPERATIFASLDSISASVVVEVVQVPADIVSLSGQDLAGSVGDPLEDSVRVRVADARGNGVPGIAVFYNVVSGEGTPTPAQSVTGSDGTSTTEWSLGPIAGVHQLEVRVVKEDAKPAGATRSPLEDIVIIIEAEAGPGPPSGIAVTPSGQILSAGQVGSVNGTVVDQFGNSVDGEAELSISWLSSDPSVVSVAASGRVTAGMVGTATIAGSLDSDSAITGFGSVTVVQGSPASVMVASGDGQSGLPGSVLAAPLVVVVEDGSGNPVPDVSVVWAVTNGAATFGAGSSNTDAAGQALVYVTLGVTDGPVEITASVDAAEPATFTATVIPPMLVTTSSPMPSGTMGVAYSETLAAAGGEGSYTWALLNATTLPTGLALNTATGAISGTPTAAGTRNFEVEVTSAAQTATKALSITIGHPAPSVTTSSPMPSGTMGVAYSETLAATGGDGSYTWAPLNATTLPAGLELNTATISGTPTAAGTTNFEVEVTSAAQTAAKSLTITIGHPAPSVTTSSPMPNGTVSVAYSEALAGAGGDGNYTWALFNATTLPAGLALDTATGAITGLPTALGTTNFEVEVTSAARTATKALAITVQLPDFTQATNNYLAGFATAGDIRWAADAGDHAASRTYYDRSYAWYAFGETARGDADQQDLMDTYWDPNNGILPPRHWAPDGLVEHYLRSGDAALLESLRQTAVHATSSFINKGWVGGGSWEGRIQERALLVTMAADAMGVTQTFDWREEARVVKDAILATQNADGSWTPPGSGYTSVNTGEQVSTNFMSAIAMSSLIRYAEYYDDDVANIRQTVDDGMEWMWTTQWVSAGGGFKYYSDQAPGGGPGAAPDLNMLFVDVFGWLYYKTGDTKWITRGDEIFQAAVTRATYNVGVKHFNQFFRNSWRYLYYRDGYDISTLQNPTEAHR